MKYFIFSLVAMALTANITFAQGPESSTSAVLTNDIDMLVFQIASANVVHEAAIGFAGSKSTQYKRYEALAKAAKTDKLLDLVSHDNAAVRVYAFKALKSRNYNALSEISDTMEKDDTEVSYMNGCILSKASVADIVSSNKGNQLIPISTPFKISGISDGRM